MNRLIDRCLPTGTLPRQLQTLLQVLALIGFWYAADRAVAWLHLPFSGGVAGLLALVVLMLSGTVRPSSIQLGANWLLSHMLLFFIPLVVSVVQFTALLKSDGLRLFLSIGLGFSSVLLATAVTVEWVCRLDRGRTLKRLRRQRAQAAAAG